MTINLTPDQLFQVCPQLPIDDARSGAFRYTELFGKGTPSNARVGQVAYFKHLLICKFRATVLAADWSPSWVLPFVMAFTPRDAFWMRRVAVSFTDRAATFFLHVAHVISVCTEEKVVGVDTRGIITLMAYEKPRRDRAIVEFIRKT